MDKSTPDRRNLIDALEAQTRRSIGITFHEHEAAGKYVWQENSPLFTLLPREIRDLIWAFTLAPFEDQSHPFESNEYYYRPGHTARLKTDTTLLRTCRRIWLEANQLAMLQAEHFFYFHRAAPDARDPAWMASLTAHNRQNFGYLHMFVQMFAIEGLGPESGRLRKYFLKTPMQPNDFQPRVFHVTLRHTDWWFWESDQALRLQDGWVQAMLNSPDLRSTQTFKLELETLDYKMPQLESILERLRKLEGAEIATHIINGEHATTKFVLLPHEEVYTWTGPTMINGSVYNPYKDMTELKYVVTTLTWKLRFPEHPRAFIPEMRRAPRILPNEDEDVLSLQDSYYSEYSQSTTSETSFAFAYDNTDTVDEQGDSDEEDDGLPMPGAFPLVAIRSGHDKRLMRLLRASQIEVAAASSAKADEVEAEREGLFHHGMAHLILTRKWEAQRSLLRLVE